MLLELETLVALSHHQTMTQTATYLRISQSAVSKRIASLEAMMGRQLIDRTGRRIALTPEAKTLVAKAAPLISQIQDLTDSIHHRPRAPRVLVGIAESVLIGWFSAFLAGFTQNFTAWDMEYHAHRSPVVLDHVLAGRYPFGIVAGEPGHSRELIVEPLVEEALVVVSGKPLIADEVEVTTIEKGAFSHRYLAEPLTLKPEGLPRMPELRVSGHLESFAVIATLAKEGVLAGVIPKPLVSALAIPSRFVRYHLEQPRPISLICRKRTFQELSPAPLVQGVRQFAATHLANFV